jgi:hypothetical protein
MSMGAGKSARITLVILCIVAQVFMLGFGGTLTTASADEKDARNLFKAMSDYMAAQKAISYRFDTNLDVVTTDLQKLGLASTGTLTLNRPDKFHIRRTGGFADVEFLFDGKILTVLGKTANLYDQLEVPGTIDHLIDELRDKYGKPVPGADLLLSNINDALMATVVDVKDLGSGVIGGIECDHLAFRTKEVDWQIWIAQGSRPYPCRYVITNITTDQAPQYSITISDWKTGDEVGADDFSFKNVTSAKKINLADIPNIDELPQFFAIGGRK